jgi:hypothetical protein
MRRSHAHPSIVLAAMLASVVGLAVATGAVGAAPVDNEHFGPEYETFPDSLCGIDGTSSTRFVGNFKLYADGTFLSTSNFRQTFTSATGKQVDVSGVEQVTGPFDPTDNGDGTLTQTFVFKGSPMKVSLPHGPVLIRDAGNATVAITFELEPDGSRGPSLSSTVTVQHGPHPMLDDDALFCQNVVAALA